MKWTCHQCNLIRISSVRELLYTIGFKVACFVTKSLVYKGWSTDNDKEGGLAKAECVECQWLQVWEDRVFCTSCIIYLLLMVKRNHRYVFSFEQSIIKAVIKGTTVLG